MDESNHKQNNSKQRMDIYVVEDAKGRNGEERSYWTKIGVAFENRDGSYSITLAALPVSGRLQMRKPTERQERDVTSSAIEKGDRAA